MANQTILTVEDVNFKNIIHYKNIRITCEKATFITGKSGVGKSTLFKLLNRTNPLTNGLITYNGKNLNDYDSSLLRQEILLVDQAPFLFDMSIKGNFETFYHYRELDMPGDHKIMDILKLLDLSFPLAKASRELSGGEKQRLFTAINLSLTPRVILLDEPTASLDYKTSQLVMGNIIEYCKKHTITPIIICHDLSLADKFADDTITFGEVDHE